MKFMMIVKSSEKSGHPPQALMDEIDKLSNEAGNTMLAVVDLARPRWEPVSGFPVER